MRDNAEPVRREPDEMAGDPVTIELVLTAGFKLAELALQLATWLRESRKAKPVTITVDEWETEVSARDVANSRSDRLLRALVGAPDPRRSRCVLFGVSKYEHLRNLAKVRGGLDELRDALVDPAIWGIPESRLTTIEDPPSADVIRQAISSAATDSPEVLMVYFAGHGLKNTDDGLLLALPGADRRELSHVVSWDDLAAMVDGCGARRVIVLLDCCYAGGAIAGGVMPANTYVLAASHRAARFLQRDRCTAFTGELVEVLHRGVRPGRPTEVFVSFDSIFKQLRLRLRSRNLPEPSKGGSDSIGSWPIFYNQLGAGNDPKLTSEPEVRLRKPVPVFVAAAGVLVLILAGLVSFLTPGPVVSGLDLAKYCSTLAPGGSTSFVIAGQDCVRPVNLDDACVYSYATYGLRARFASRDPNSAECVGPGAGAASYGGISNMSGYCATSSKVPDVIATSKNEDYMNQWMCQLDINTDLACNAQNNSLELSAREEDNGDLECYRTHWF